jgi:hypothetical protein
VSRPRFLSPQPGTPQTLHFDVMAGRTRRNSAPRSLFLCLETNGSGTLIACVMAMLHQLSVLRGLEHIRVPPPGSSYDFMCLIRRTSKETVAIQSESGRCQNSLK